MVVDGTNSCLVECPRVARIVPTTEPKLRAAPTQRTINEAPLFKALWDSGKYYMRVMELIGEKGARFVICVHEGTPTNSIDCVT